MHVKDINRTGAFMKIINILCDQKKPFSKKIFDIDQGLMCLIRKNRFQLFAAFVVEVINQLRLSLEPFRSCYVVNVIIFPQAFIIPKCLHPAFSANPRASKNNCFGFRVTPKKVLKLCYIHGFEKNCFRPSIPNRKYSYHTLSKVIWPALK